MITLLVVGNFLWQNYRLSNFIQEQLLLMNEHEIWLSGKTQTISAEINKLTTDFVNKALQNEVDNGVLEQTKKRFAKIDADIKEIQESEFLDDKIISESLVRLQSRLKGYSAILLDLPEAHRESDEDAIYAIVSLGSVKNKMLNELNTLLRISKKYLNEKIESMQEMVSENKRDTIFLTIVTLVLLFLINSFMIQEIMGSIRLLQRVNKSFSDFLSKKSDHVEKITHFPEDEIGQILRLIDSNIAQTEVLIKKERKLADEVHKLNATLEDRVKSALAEITELNKEIEDTQREVIFTMGAIGESRSKETGNHVKRVAEYSRALALLYGMDEEEANLLKEASPMHDIGKVAIPDHILNKPARLTKEEFEIMKTHAQIGYDMLKHSNRPILKTAAIIAHQHHEKYDGSGYPQGLKGDEIHIYGQITAIVDVFDALGVDRVYKKAWSLDRIVALFQEEKGKHFNPELTQLFLDNLDIFLAIRDRYKDIENEKERREELV